MAFTISPVYLMPPSAMMPISLFLNGSFYFHQRCYLRYTRSGNNPCGANRTRANTNFYSISALHLQRLLRHPPVAMFPAITSRFLKSFFIFFKASITPFVCPCALSRHITSTPTCCRAYTLSFISFVMPIPAPTSNLPKVSLVALG